MSASREMKLIHDGDFAGILPFMPRVSTVTISDGWDRGMVGKFPSVITEVVTLNPILTGRAVKSKKGMHVEMGAFSASEHSFGNVHDFTDKGRVIEGMTNGELVDFVEGNIVPFIAEKLKESVGLRDSRCTSMKSNVAAEIKHGLPLFEANLFLLDQSMCAYHISMSHAVGDAATYYMIVDQISCLLKGGKVNSINWDNPHMSSHELHAPNLDEKGIKTTMMKYASPAGVVWKMITGGKRKSNFIFTDSRAIQQKKDEMVGAGNGYLSSNDIITAALCRINITSEFVFTNMDMRERETNMSRNDGGTILSLIPTPIVKSKDPNIVRQTVDKTYFPPKGFVPSMWHVVQGKYLSITNWSSVSSHFSSWQAAYLFQPLCIHSQTLL